MKKKLLFWEAVMIVVIIGVFLIIFSIKNGWELTGAERYSVSVVAALAAAGVVIAVSLADGVADASVAVSAGVVVAAFATACVIVATGVVVAALAPATAGVIATGVVALATAGVVAVTAAIGPTGDKELKNPFAIISLSSEGFVIFGTISVIIFLL